MGCTQSHPGGPAAQFGGKGWSSASHHTSPKAGGRAGGGGGAAGGGRCSPRPSPHASPVPTARAGHVRHPPASVRKEKAVERQRAVVGSHPQRVEEVALRLGAALTMPEALKQEVVREVQFLAPVLGKTVAGFAAMVTEDYQYKMHASNDLIHYLLYHFVQPDQGRITKDIVEEMLFSSTTRPPVSVKGGFVEGTGHEEHFVIGGPRSVVTGGCGQDVFMFLPRSKELSEDAVHPHIITDFDPSEDLIDLRAVPIWSFGELQLEDYGHHHCQVRGAELDVVLIGVNSRQLEEAHFIFSASEDRVHLLQGGGAAAGSDAAGDAQVPQQQAQEAPSVFVFTHPGEVTSSEMPDIFVILPAANREHVIKNFQVGSPEMSGIHHDRIDLRGLHVSGTHQLKITQIERDGQVSALVSLRGASVCLVGVFAADITARHFIFAKNPAARGSVVADAPVDGVERAAPPLVELSLGTEVFKCVVYWCLDLIAGKQGPQAGGGGASPGHPPGDVLAGSPRDMRIPVSGQGARHSPIPFGSACDLNLIGVAIGSVDSNPACSPTSSSVTNPAVSDWCKRLSKESEGRRIKRNIDRLVAATINKMFEVTYGKVMVAISERTLFRVRPRQMPRLQFNPNVETLLPPQVPNASGRAKYTIVLDLDETMVYSRHMHQTHHLCVRHGVHDLMVLLKQYGCEVVMWSAADAETVNAVWTAIDPTGITSHVLPREAWQRGVYEQKKDLTRLGRDLDWVLIIDNTPLAVAGQTSNALVVRDYLGGDHAFDRKDELYRLMKLLSTMFMQQAPVPEFLNSCAELARVTVTRRQQNIEFNMMHHVALYQD